MKALQILKLVGAVALLFGTVACGPKASERILGKWSIDLAESEKLEDIKSLDADKRTMAMAAIAALAPNTSIEITKDKIVTETGADKKERAYAIRSETGYQVICDVTADGKVEPGTLTFQGEVLVLNQRNPKMTVALKRK